MAKYDKYHENTDAEETVFFQAAKDGKKTDQYDTQQLNAQQIRRCASQQPVYRPPYEEQERISIRKKENRMAILKMVIFRMITHKMVIHGMIILTVDIPERVFLRVGYPRNGYPQNSYRQNSSYPNGSGRTASNRQSQRYTAPNRQRHILLNRHADRVMMHRINVRNSRQSVHHHRVSPSHMGKRPDSVIRDMKRPLDAGRRRRAAHLRVRRRKDLENLR